MTDRQTFAILESLLQLKKLKLLLSLSFTSCLIMPIFRCLFMKYGTQTTVTASIKGSSFFKTFFTICHAAMFYNICSYIWIFYGNSEGQRNHFILYHVCYDPNQKYSSSIFTAMPVSTLLVFISNFVLIGGSFYLYRFLQSNTEKRAGESLKLNKIACTCIKVKLSWTRILFPPSYFGGVVGWWWWSVWL